MNQDQTANMSQKDKTALVSALHCDM